MSTLKVNAIRQTAASSDAVTLAADGTCTAKITNNLSNRNLIINGAMQIAQRGTSFADPSDGTYVMDRWKIRNPTGTPAITWTKDSESPDGFASSLKCDCTTADTSLAAGDFHRLEYHFEGRDLQLFAKGTASAKKGILSFYVKTNKTGAYVVNFYDNDNGRGFSAAYTVANSNWNRYTISIPADTTGAWGNDSGGSLSVNWGLALGSNRNSGSTGDLPTAWGSHANNTQFAGQVNFADSTSNDWYLTGVQLEVGSVATPFEHRSYGDELARCQRYYYKTPYGGYYVGAGNGTSTLNHTAFPFPVAMRAQPAAMNAVNILVTSSSTYASHNSKTPSIGAWCETGAQLDWTGISATVDNRIGAILLNGPNGQLTFDSEL